MSLIILLSDILIIFILIYVFYTIILMLISNKNLDVINENLDIRAIEYVFLIPCCNEEIVIEKTVKSIDLLDYDKKMIIVIDDASEDNTVNVVKNIKCKSKLKVIRRKYPNAQKGKGEALNYAYKKILRGAKLLNKNLDNIVLVVVDADGRPSENLLVEANRVFSDSKIGAAQSRISITNREKLLPILQDIEFFTVVSAIQKVRKCTTSVCLGGNGQFTRLSTLVQLGENPWSKCLLEDFDLGLSILLKEWKIAYLEHAIMYQQGLISIKRFIRQRSRWVQGNLQSIIRFKEIINSKIEKLAKVDLIYFLFQPWINLLNGIIFFTTILIDINIIIKYHIMFNNFSYRDIILLIICILILFGNGLVWGVFHILNYKKNGEKLSIIKTMIGGIIFPIYNVISLASVFMAYKRQIFKNEGWIKTERVEEQNK